MALRLFLTSATPPNGPMHRTKWRSSKYISRDRVPSRTGWRSRLKSQGNNARKSRQKPSDGHSQPREKLPSPTETHLLRDDRRVDLLAFIVLLRLLVLIWRQKSSHEHASVEEAGGKEEGPREPEGCHSSSRFCLQKGERRLFLVSISLFLKKKRHAGVRTRKSNQCQRQTGRKTSETIQISPLRKSKSSQVGIEIQRFAQFHEKKLS